MWHRFRVSPSRFRFDVCMYWKHSFLLFSHCTLTYPAALFRPSDSPGFAGNAPENENRGRIQEGHLQCFGAHAHASFQMIAVAGLRHTAADTRVGMCSAICDVICYSGPGRSHQVNRCASSQQAAAEASHRRCRCLRPPSADYESRALHDSTAQVVSLIYSFIRIASFLSAIASSVSVLRTLNAAARFWCHFVLKLQNRKRPCVRKMAVYAAFVLCIMTTPQPATCTQLPVWSTARLSVARWNVVATSVGNVALFAGGEGVL